MGKTFEINNLEKMCDNVVSFDSISREDAIEAIKFLPPYREYWKGTRKVLYKKEDIIKALKALPSSEDETKCVAQIKVDTEEIVRRIKEEYDITDRWIPCSERLPEEREWVGTKSFGTTKSDTILMTFDVDGTRFVKPLSLQNGKLSKADAKTMDAFYKGWKMVAWQPLPKPYRKDDER